MKYIGETCPVCGSVFAEGEDIVVCPECGTPSHRECWQKEGKCINEDKHGEFLWSPTEAEYVEAEQVEAEKAPDSSVSKLCPFCSARNDENAVFCQSCGKPFVEGNQADIPFVNQQFNQASFDVDKEIDGIKISKIARYVQINFPRYIHKFTRISEKKISFNWAAFLFNPYWFFFRKLYYVGGIFLGVQLLLSILLSFLMMQLGIDDFINEYTTIVASRDIEAMQAFMLDATPELTKMMILSSITFIPNLIAGFFADRIYKRNAFKNIKKIEESGDPDNLAVYVKNGAGVSLLAAGFSMLGYEALITLLSSLL